MRHRRSMSDVQEIDGTDWSDAEQDLIVAAYFDMLKIELTGGTVNKAERNRALQALTGRKRTSIEYKHMNVSEALKRIGLPTIAGYKPYPNIQDSLVDAIDRYLSDRSALFTQNVSPPIVAVAESPPLFSAAPPVRSDERPQLRKRMQALVRKFDPVARDFRNRELGRAGEEFVVDFERRRLHDGGRKDLVEKVRWVADEEGDGHGYDIESCSLAGEKRLIEVKTTTGGATTPFFLTRNEERVSREQADFRLYRLYDFAKAPRVFKLRPPLGNSVVLETETWRAGFG